jgi:hypothetical protein
LSAARRLHASAACSALAVILWAAAGGGVASIGGQSVTIAADAATLRVRAPGFTFIEGDVLSRLRDGQTVRVDLEVDVFAAPGGRSPVARAAQGYDVSFDLWEERFAATLVGTPPRSVSHLSAREAEAWCLEALTIPRRDLGRLHADTPFWIRLISAAADDVSVSDSEAGEALTLRRLIDWLSRRDRASAVVKTVEAGPFRFSH